MHALWSICHCFLFWFGVLINWFHQFIFWFVSSWDREFLLSSLFQKSVFMCCSLSDIWCAVHWVLFLSSSNS
jgi:hypothetical protein